MSANVSHHKTVQEQYEVVHADGISNVQDRFDAQGKRCPFCESGLRCSICSNGPCRIRPGVERGVCGIDANGMVMRQLVHQNIMGLAAYTHHNRTTAGTLIATAQGKTPFKVRDVAKLDGLATLFGLTGADTNGKLEAFGHKMIEGLNQVPTEESFFVEALAPASRKALWRELGIFPGGSAHEIVDASTRSMTNIDGDYVSLAKTALRLGIANAYCTLAPLNMAQDVLFGTPSPHAAEVDLGLLDPAYINILPNGHEPFVGFALVEAARTEKAQQMAKAAGAKGLRIIGSTETGQEMMQRLESDDVFPGMIGNWISQEYAIATGAVDVLAMDMNCSMPSLASVAEKYGTTLVAVGSIVGVPGAVHMDYHPESVAELAWKLIEMAIGNFTKRKGAATHAVTQRQKILTGFSTEAVLGALGGSLDPLLKVLTDGAIRGVAALVSCTTLKNGPQDSTTVAVAKELIKRDVLVLSAGCGNGATQVAGLNSLEAQSLAGPGLKAVCQALGVPPVLSFGTCTDCGRLALLVGAVADALGVDTAQLPIVVTAPEYMEQKATIDALSAVALGLYTHVSPVPQVTGAPDVVKLLTEDVEGITGGKLAVGDDPVQAVDGLVAHIEKKRKGLGL
jgi:anaerobic carbon-monoxide dehydrogenase catalytic subunit